jgi:hypothetical protein
MAELTAWMKDVLLAAKMVVMMVATTAEQMVGLKVKLSGGKKVAWMVELKDLTTVVRMDLMKDELLAQWMVGLTVLRMVEQMAAVMVAALAG